MAQTAGSPGLMPGTISPQGCPRTTYLKPVPSHVYTCGQMRLERSTCRLMVLTAATLPYCHSTILFVPHCLSPSPSLLAAVRKVNFRVPSFHLPWDIFQDPLGSQNHGRYQVLSSNAIAHLNQAFATPCEPHFCS